MQDMKIKLFCLPHAGGSSSIYYSWNKYIDKSKYELIPIEYAGHGIKLDENLNYLFDNLVNDVYNEILRSIKKDTKYIIFGHSMGAYIAFEVERKIEKKYEQKAFHMIFSGVDAPCYWNRNKKIASLSDAEFIEQIQTFGGINDEIINSPELMKIILPILKADFYVIESMHEYQEEFLINASSTIMNGKNDRYKKENIEHWQCFSNKACTIKYYNGGHFFINDNAKLICEYINSLN